MAKVAILYENLGRSRGGIEAWIYHVTEELMNQGHEVTLFNIQENTPSDAAPTNVKIVTLKSHTKLKIIDFYSQVLSLSKQLRHKLTEFDKVWTRSFVIAWAASKVLGKNKVVYINAAPYSFYGQLPFRVKVNRAKGMIGMLKAISSEISIEIAYSIERKAILRCKNVYLSYARMNETLQFFKLQANKSNYFVIPAGVNTSRFVPGNLIKSENEVLKIITVCRLAPDKNIQCIIKAVRILSDKGIPVVLTIAGEGAYGITLNNLVCELAIRDKVHMVGRQENIEKWYRENHVFVLPSLYEGFGSVYVEAMSCGLPCIAISNKSKQYSVAADEIIDDNVNGYLMQENDPNELSLYLSNLYFNNALLQELGRNARKKAVEVFNWKKTVNKILDLN
jgi:glycosyltransferase involved in cell wall biosynthesis